MFHRNPEVYSLRGTFGRLGALYFLAAAERAAAMRFTGKKGALRLVVAAVGVLLGQPFVKYFSVIVVCALVCIGWVLYRLIGGGRC